MGTPGNLVFELMFRVRPEKLEGMAGFSHFGSEWGKTVSQPTLLIVIIVKKDYLCAAQVNSFISGNLAQMTHPRIVLDHLCFKGMIFQISCC